MTSVLVGRPKEQSRLKHPLLCDDITQIEMKMSWFCSSVSIYGPGGNDVLKMLCMLNIPKSFQNIPLTP